CLQHNSRPLTF
nr:immunoglobulin light chain junction region [Macaca mulatta]